MPRPGGSRRPPVPDDAFVAAVDRWLAGYPSRNTRDAYRRDIVVFTTWAASRRMIPLAVTARDVARYRDTQRGGDASAATVNRRLAALSAFFAFAQQTGLRTDNPAAATARVPGAAASATARLSARERRAVWRAALAGGPRPAALVGLLLNDGLRLGEILVADVADVHRERGAVGLDVTRRGRAQRIVVDPGTAAAVTSLGRGRTEGPLFTGGANGDTNGGTDGETRLTRYGAHFIIRRVGVDASLAEPLTANRLRATHIADRHAAGDHVDDIRDRVGHRDARTTRRHLPDG